MGRGNGAATTALVGDEALAALCARIERWRRTRERRTTMPARLWAAAVALAEEHGVYPVARTLRLDYTSLKARMLEARLDRDGGAAAEAGFVEVAAAELFGPPRWARGVTVELTGADGAQMRVQMPAGESVDVVALCAAFGSHNR